MRKINFKTKPADYYTNKVRDKARENKRNLRLIVAVLFAFIAGFFGGITGANVQNDESSFSSSTGHQVISSESELITSLAKEAGPSVVSVNVLGPATRGFFGDVQQQAGAGTGFIIDGEEGVVATNRHVIGDDASSVSVTLSDGTDLDNVEVIGATSANDPLDIAFLKIADKEGRELEALPLGNSSEVEVGERVAAIGNALGQFQNTVTTGIISGYGRDIQASSDGFTTETLQNLFQTDAAINQGNSGGPLINMSGEVIGVTTAVAGGAENVGFAIPIDDLKGLIRSVLETGELARPYLGVRYVNITDDYAYEYNLDVNRGAYVLPGTEGQGGVLPDSPASKAGLQEKDIITAVDGEPVNERNSLISLISQHQVGESVALTVNRNGQERNINVTLEAAD